MQISAVRLTILIGWKATVSIVGSYYFILVTGILAPMINNVGDAKRLVEQCR